MKVEIFSDIHCPYCYVGMSRLEKALKDFDHRDEVELIYRSYELNPSAEVSSKDSIYEVMAKKQNISIMDAMAYYEQLEEAGRLEGVTFDMEMLIPTNTFDALRLSHYAKKFGKQVPLMKRLFKAHFEEGIDVGDIQALARLGEEVGLAKDEVQKVLESSDYKEDVVGDHASATLMGISSVPYYVLNEKFGMAGAQSVEDFLSALNEAYAR